MTAKQNLPEWNCRQAQVTDITQLITCWYGLDAGTPGHNQLTKSLHHDTSKLHHCWIAERGVQVQAVVWLALQSPTYAHGWPLRSIFHPGSSLHQQCSQELWKAVGDWYGRLGVRCIQTLIPCDQQFDIDTMTQVGFQSLACIQRFGRSLSTSLPSINPPTLKLRPVEVEDESHFARSLQETFIDSLDVAELNDLDNSVRDDLYSADSGLYRYLVHHPEHGLIGVAVLDCVAQHAVLRYLGLVPPYRQQGYGSVVVTLLLEQAARLSAEHIEVRVDSRNLPALRLYQGQHFNWVEDETMLIYRLTTSP